MTLNVDNGVAPFFYSFTFTLSFSGGSAVYTAASANGGPSVGPTAYTAGAIFTIFFSGSPGICYWYVNSTLVNSWASGITPQLYATRTDFNTKGSASTYTFTNVTAGNTGGLGTQGTQGTQGPGFSSITNTADNRVLTSLGTTNTANAEANLTFDGTALSLTGTFNKIPTNEGYYTSQNSRGTTATFATRWTQVSANNTQLTFTDSAANGSYWTVNVSGFYSLIIVGTVQPNYVSMYRTTAAGNPNPQTASQDRFTFQYLTATSSNEWTNSAVVRLLAGEIFKVVSQSNLAATYSYRTTLVAAI